MRPLLISLLTLCVLQTSAQYTLRNYSVKEGLPQSQVQIMLEDENGYLWIGTYGGGLARYDGREFKIFTTRDGLLSNIITYLKFDDNQNLWIVHPRGITKFDGSRFKKFAQPETPNNLKRVRRLFEVGDSIFFITAPGLLGKIYNDSVLYWARPVIPGKTISYSHLLPDKTMMLYLNDSTFVIAGSNGNSRISHKRYFNRITNIFNEDSKVWFKTDSGLFHYDYINHTFSRSQHWVRNHVVNFDAINNVFWTRYDNLFIREYLKDGVPMADTVLRGIDVNQVFNDSEGNTWFATYGSGLYKYFEQDFAKCGSARLRAIMAIHKDSNGFSWLGSSGGGVWRMKGPSIHNYFDEHTPYRNFVTCIAESPDGQIWVGTQYGLGRYNEQHDQFEWYTREQGLSHITIINIQFDEKGGMWIGTLGGGINYFDGKQFTSFEMKNGLRNNAIHSLYYEKKSQVLYFGDEFGLGYINHGTTGYIPIRAIENTSVLSIQQLPGGRLLAGTAGAGIAVIDPVTRFTKVIGTLDGLPSDFVYFATPDEKGYIWIGSERGITRIKLSSGLEITENLHFDNDNGLTGVETNQNAFYISPSSKMFGLVDGVYEFNEKRKEVKQSFDVHLTGLELFYGAHQADEFADKLDGFYKIPVNPVLPYNKNHVTFRFNRVDKSYPKSVRFRYFMKNFDKTWSQPSSANYATYSNLPPGEYVFQVMSTDSRGSWSNRIVSYPLVVKAPFYRTTAFLIGMAVLVIGIVFFIYYLQVKAKLDRTILMERIRAQEQDGLRKEIARDFHDEMGNQLTRIINYVSLLKMNGHANGNGHADLYTKVENSAKYLYDGTRDFIWAIDPVNDELSKLFLHIRDFGEKLFEEKGIDFRAFNNVKRKIRLPYGFSREANLIFKEVMTNSFKHSEAKNVKLSLMEENGQFIFMFEDDGVGFDYAQVQASNGLRNIRDRAERLTSILRLSTSREEGTRITLIFTLKQTSTYGITI